ncbi:MAG: EF-hand domain-containing protein [Isosphaeraceae bacterium]
MKRLVYTMTVCGLLAAIPMTLAQQAGDGRATGGGDRTKARAKSRTKNATVDSVVARMMTFDENGDGQLTRDEVNDERLHRLFDRADANHDGTVTRQELSALASREPAGNRGRFGGPGGFGPPPSRPGGFGMGPPRPGEVLPSMLRNRLQLTPEQSQQVDALQKDVDTRLERILTADQKAQLKQMRERGPGGPGGFGPPPGDGPPPGGFGPPPGAGSEPE